MLNRVTLIKVMLVALLVAQTTANKGYSQDGFPLLQGAYLGQQTPGVIPKVFAKGLVSIAGRYEYGVTFSADLKEIYFSAQLPDKTADIYFSTVENNLWQPFKKANFTQGDKAGEMEPFLSLDGKQMYFTAYNADFSDTKIWLANRKGKKWQSAKKLDSPINDEEVFFSTLAKNGDLFFTDIFKSQTYYSAFINGHYGKPKKVAIDFGVHGFISPTRDYLLVDSRSREEASRTDSDIYVYFKQPDQTWSKAINLGTDINSAFSETVPSVTPDGKFMFFSRYDEQHGISNLYWVSTEVIESLRPKSLR